MIAADPRIPVTLITGFLGVGKTLVLKHRLRCPEAGPVAIIIKEFSDTGLDHDLIESATEIAVTDRIATLPHWPAGDRSSCFVVIGRDLRRDLLEESRLLLRARPSADPEAKIVVHRLSMPF
jgi:G3E family GTPase